jgi:hypothetical protein
VHVFTRLRLLGSQLIRRKPDRTGQKKIEECHTQARSRAQERKKSHFRMVLVGERDHKKTRELQTFSESERVNESFCVDWLSVDRRVL